MISRARARDFLSWGSNRRSGEERPKLFFGAFRRKRKAFSLFRGCGKRWQTVTRRTGLAAPHQGGGLPGAATISQRHWFEIAFFNSTEAWCSGTNGLVEVARSQMSIVFFYHACVRMAEVGGNNEQRNAIHHAQACPSVPELMEAQRWVNLCACAGGTHGPSLFDFLHCPSSSSPRSRARARRPRFWSMNSLVFLPAVSARKKASPSSVRRTWRGLPDLDLRMAILPC